MTEFITRNYGNKEYEVIIKTDCKEHYKVTEDFARKLIDHAKPQTNADRIRDMSDYELAELFGAIIREREIILLRELREKGVEASIVEMPELTFNAHLEWLQQPVE